MAPSLSEKPQSAPTSPDHTSPHEALGVCHVRELVPSAATRTRDHAAQPHPVDNAAHRPGTSPMWTWFTHQRTPEIPKPGP